MGNTIRLLLTKVTGSKDRKGILLKDGCCLKTVSEPVTDQWIAQATRNSAIVTGDLINRFVMQT